MRSYCFFQFSMSCSTRVFGCELTLAMLGGRSLGSADEGDGKGYCDAPPPYNCGYGAPAPDGEG